MKTFRVMKMDRTMWILLAKEGRRDQWRTVSRHDSLKTARTAKAHAARRELKLHMMRPIEAETRDAT